MITITVSTNYDDLLNIIIPQNYKFFEKWYIVTDKSDDKTINVINKYNYDNIYILYFDFYENNKKFNKGGAIRYCQEKIISTLDYSGNILILDSDIYLPNNFSKIMNIKLIENTIYGTNKRYDFYSYKNFINKIIDLDYPWSKKFQGYFQLYKYNKNFLYEESNNCGECDLRFLKYFKNKRIITNLSVYHLGKSGINWNKRINKDDFII